MMAMPRCRDLSFPRDGGDRGASDGRTGSVWASRAVPHRAPVDGGPGSALAFWRPCPPG